MKVSRIFPIEEVKAFNEFIIDHPPVGKDGLKLLPTYMYMEFDNGSVFSKVDRIARLISEFNELSLREIEEERQLREQIAIRDSFDYFTEKKNWKAVHDNLITFKKTLELTQIHLKVIAEMLAEMGDGTKYVQWSKVPEISEEPVSAEPEEKVKKKK